MRLIQSCVLISFFFSEFVSGANVLYLSTVVSPSHTLWNQKLVLLLANNGHQVWVLDPMEQKVGVHPNVTYYQLEKGLEHGEDFSRLEEYAAAMDVVSGIRLLADYSDKSCSQAVRSKGLREFRSAAKSLAKFDLVIEDATLCPCFLGLLEETADRETRLVQVTAFIDPNYVARPGGAFPHPAAHPYLLSSLRLPLSFSARLLNLYYFLAEYYYWDLLGSRRQNLLAKETFGPDTRPLEEIAGEKRSLLLLNTHHSVGGPTTPAPLSVRYIAGLHIDPPSPLPKEILEFVEGAEEGVILFSLGTNIQSSDMSPRKRDLFLEAFSRLPQRVLWKWNADRLPSKPKNVLVTKWLPQSSVLAHPKVKLFISHGGQLSFQEAVHHGVPMIIIPFLVDQHATANRLHDRGIAIKLDFLTITAERLLSAVTDITGDNRYKERMEAWSREWLDRPMTPRAEALYWIEYVLRHPPASLVPPSLSLPLYQFLLLDVLALLLAVFAALFLAFYCLLRLFRSPAKTPRTKSKVN